MSDSLDVCLTCLLAFVVLAQPAPVADPIGSQLEQAKAKYHSAQAEYRAAVTIFLERREEAARKNGDKQLVDRIKSELQAFEEKGSPPGSLPSLITSRRDRARSGLQTAYENAIKGYIRAGNDSRADAVEREWKTVRKDVFRPADAAEFEGKVYKVFDERLRWHDAKKKCESMGGRLAVVTSKAQDRFIFLLAQKLNVHEVYLGATDESKEGVWLWITGEEMSYQNWGPLQPTNSKGVEHYLALRIRSGTEEYIGKWNDLPDWHPILKVGYVCQWD